MGVDVDEDVVVLWEMIRRCSVERGGGVDMWVGDVIGVVW